MKIYIQSAIIVYLLINQIFANPFGTGSFVFGGSKEPNGVRLYSEIKKEEAIYKAYEKEGYLYFSIRREGEENDEELCSFPSRDPSLPNGELEVVLSGSGSGPRLVDVIESEGKITLLIAVPSSYAVLNFIGSNTPLDKGEFVFGKIGTVNEKWILSNMVKPWAFDMIPGWCHEEFYESVKLVNHKEIWMKEKPLLDFIRRGKDITFNKDKAAVYKILPNEIQRNGVKLSAWPSPNMAVKTQDDLIVYHKRFIHKDEWTNSEIIDYLESYHGGKDRFLEILTQMEDKPKAAELKDRINAAYTNSENNK